MNSSVEFTWGVGMGARLLPFSWPTTSNVLRYLESFVPSELHVVLTTLSIGGFLYAGTDIRKNGGRGAFSSELGSKGSCVLGRSRRCTLRPFHVTLPGTNMPVSGCGVWRQYWIGGIVQLGWVR
eukprot:8099794-Pyramimonas_sp.AAC.1